MNGMPRRAFTDRRGIGARKDPGCYDYHRPD